MARKGRKKFKIRKFAHTGFLAWLLRRIVAPLVKLWFSTCRVSLLNDTVWEEYAYNDDQVVVGTWHRAAIFFLYFFGKFGPMIMISQSKDGEILAHFCAAMGAIPARGSSSKGGKQALEQMRRHLTSGGKACATVLDGPRGPAYVAKKGMIVLSKLTGVPFIPVIWSANRTITLKNSWDKMVLPLPFSKVYMANGDPIHIPANATKEELESYRQQIEKILNRLTEEVDRLSGYR